MGTESVSPPPPKIRRPPGAGARRPLYQSHLAGTLLDRFVSGLAAASVSAVNPSSPPQLFSQPSDSRRCAAPSRGNLGSCDPSPYRTPTILWSWRRYPRFLTRFSRGDCSHGFRQGRGVQTFFCAAESWGRIETAISADIVGCFDNTPHAGMTEALERYVDDPRLVGPIRNFMTTDISDRELCLRLQRAKGAVPCPDEYLRARWL